MLDLMAAFVYLAWAGRVRHSRSLPCQRLECLSSLEVDIVRAYLMDCRGLWSQNLARKLSRIFWGAPTSCGDRRYNIRKIGMMGRWTVQCLEMIVQLIWNTQGHPLPPLSSDIFIQDISVGFGDRDDLSLSVPIPKTFGCEGQVPSTTQSFSNSARDPPKWKRVKCRTLLIARYYLETTCRTWHILC